MGPRLGRVTGRTGKILLRYCLLVKVQLHYLGKSNLAERESDPEYLETARTDVFVEEVEMKCLVNTRAPSAGPHSCPAPKLARVGSWCMHTHNPWDKSIGTVSLLL